MINEEYEIVLKPFIVNKKTGAEFCIVASTGSSANGWDVMNYVSDICSELAPFCNTDDFRIPIDEDIAKNYGLKVGQPDSPVMSFQGYDLGEN